MRKRLKTVMFSLTCMFFLFSLNGENERLFANDSLPFEGQEATKDDENVNKQYGQYNSSSKVTNKDGKTTITDKETAQDSLKSINGGSGSIVDMEGVTVF